MTLRILLLADDQKGHPDTIHDHIRMFRRYSRHDVRILNPRGLRRSRFLKLDAFDVLVIHYSIVVIWDDYLAPWLREEISRFHGLKVQFLQDEYRWVDSITTGMRELGIETLYSVVPPDTVVDVYGERLPNTEVIPTLTGYVPERLASHVHRPISGRPIDVGYRGRSMPYWLGRLGHEKIEIGREFVAHARGLGLRTDIAWTEGARIYGSRWTEFMRSCRTMLASESGSSVVDWDGSVEAAVRGYLAEHPGAPYVEVEREVLAQVPPGPSINTLSPRVFEAAALRTGMVMFPGEYSGAIRPWDHYIPLEKDFSNVAEVAERIRDDGFLTELTTRAYEDLIASARYSERQFVAEFDDHVASRARPRTTPRRRYPERLLKLEQASTGRTYHLSTLYGFAREAILAYLGAKSALRAPVLRRLLRSVRPRSSAPGATPLWDDLFRLAILTSVQQGQPILAGDPFRLVGTFDAPRGRLTLTSRPGNGSVAIDEAAAGAFAEAVRAGSLREVLWSHAGLEQYVPLRFGPGGLRIAFDVGRYDAYGVYRFDALAALARERPDDVVAALTPLIGKADRAATIDPDIHAKRGPRP